MVILELLNSATYHLRSPAWEDQGTRSFSAWGPWLLHVVETRPLGGIEFCCLISHKSGKTKTTKVVGIDTRAQAKHIAELIAENHRQWCTEKGEET